MTHPLISSTLRFALRTVIGLVLTVIIAMGVYLLFSYHFTYSKGESVGFVQKLSYKGWICKTWEGEQVRALAVMPAIPEKSLEATRLKIASMPLMAFSSLSYSKPISFINCLIFFISSPIVDI